MSFAHAWQDPKSLCEPFHRWCQAFVLAVAKSRVKLCDFSAKNLVRIQEIVADAVKSEEVYVQFVIFYSFRFRLCCATCLVVCSISLN